MTVTQWQSPDVILIWLEFLRSNIQRDGDRLETVHRTLEEAIASVQEHVASLPADDDDHPWVGAMIEDEQAEVEDLLGVAFVSIQTYLTTVRSQVATLSGIAERHGRPHLSFLSPTPAGEKRPRSKRLLRVESPAMLGSPHSEAELINAVANYWKHYDEWEEALDWSKLPPGSQSRDTADKVQLLGMQPNSSGNIRTAVAAFGVTDPKDLSPIRARALAWAQRLHAVARKELGY